MKLNLQDYVRVYKNISAEVCNKSLDELETADWQPHTFYNSITNNVYSNPNDCHAYYGRLSNDMDLIQCIGKTLNQYISEIDVVSFKELKQFSPIVYHRYTEGCEMEVHTDHIHSLFDGEKKGIPVLSIVGLLNDNYTGGDFIMFDDLKIKLTAGDFIVFPSVFLYPHKISKVLSGTRNSFVSWAW